MRSIKFRAIKHGGGWHYFGIDELTEVIKKETVGQFTGLLDKSGKEIYEGDVVQLETTHAFDETSTLGVIKYDNSVVSFVLKAGGPTRIDETQDLEVIGNIYENPDLLTKDEKR